MPGQIPKGTGQFQNKVAVCEGQCYIDVLLLRIGSRKQAPELRATFGSPKHLCKPLTRVPWQSEQYTIKTKVYGDSAMLPLTVSTFAPCLAALAPTLQPTKDHCNSKVDPLRLRLRLRLSIKLGALTSDRLKNSSCFSSLRSFLQYLKYCALL